MNQNDLNIEEKIIKYLSGEADSKEIQWLELWVKASENNKDTYLSIKQSWNLVSANLDKEIDLEKEWQFFSEKIENQKAAIPPKVRSIKWFNNYSIAAVFLLLVVALIWILYPSFSGNIQEFNSENLVVNNELSDGSIVSLNKHSSVRFSNEEKRQVNLLGSAFFEVKRNPEKEFVVMAEDLHVRVLGTAFYIDANSNSDIIEVIVESGRVLVQNDQDSLILISGEKAEYHRIKKTLFSSSNIDVNYLSWKTGYFEFSDLTLAEVIIKLKEVFGVELRVENKKMEACRITVSFRDQELSSILSVIAQTLDLELDERDGHYVFRGQGCGAKSSN